MTATTKTIKSSKSDKSSKTTTTESKAMKDATSAPVSAPKGDAAHTLADLATAYLAALETKGTSIMTRASYEADLKVALKALGEKTTVTALTPRRVGNFFESDEVTKTKGGRAKATPTILKTRRVLRLALVWAQEQRWITEAPIPEAYQRRKGKKKEG